MIEGGDSYSEDDDFEHESSVEHVSESKVAESLQETGVSAAGSQDPGPAVAAFRPAQRSPAQAQLRSQSVSPAGSTDPAARVRAATLRKLQRENRDLLERLRRTRSGPEVQLPTALVVHASRNGRQGWSPSPPRRARPESPADDISRFPSELASKYLDIRKKLRGAHTAWELLKQEYDALVARAAEVERVECVSDLLNRLGELDMRLGELRTENSTLKKEGKRIGRAASSYKPEGDAFEATVQRLRREISQARAEQKKSAAAVKAAQGEQDKVHSQMVRLKVRGALGAASREGRGEGGGEGGGEGRGHGVAHPPARRAWSDASSIRWKCLSEGRCCPRETRPAST